MAKTLRPKHPQEGKHDETVIFMNGSKPRRILSMMYGIWPDDVLRGDKIEHPMVHGKTLTGQVLLVERIERSSSGKMVVVKADDHVSERVESVIRSLGLCCIDVTGVPGYENLEKQ